MEAILAARLYRALNRDLPPPHTHTHTGHRLNSMRIFDARRLERCYCWFAQIYPVDFKLAD